ncbi:MAG: MbcA/ParS/Xre antitoxin family protein [Rubrivivax sp.]
MSALPALALARDPAAAEAPSFEPAQLAAPGLRAFERIAQAWKLSVDEQLCLLGQPPRSTFFAWRKHPERASLPRDTLERLSYLLGIWKSLQILLPEPDAADGWLRRPNRAPAFGGRSALARMLGGNVSDLHAVRTYLDGVRGGGWS